MFPLTFESGATPEGETGNTRRLRAGSRSLHVVLLAAAGLGAATVLHRLRPSPERDAIETVRRSGGTVTLAHSESHPFPSDPDAGTFGPIAILEVYDPEIVRTAMWDTGILTYPESLRSLWAPLDDGDLERLQPFRNLESLTIYGGRVSDSALEHLTGLHQLQRLTIHDLDIGDAGIHHLCRLPQLRELFLGGTCITDVAMRDIGQLDRLTTLVVAGTRMTDAGVEFIADLRDLEALDLANTDLTDTGLAHLGELDRLRKLNLDKTSITEDGLRTLQRRLPMCQVILPQHLKMSAATKAIDDELESIRSTEAIGDSDRETPAGTD